MDCDAEGCYGVNNDGLKVSSFAALRRTEPADLADFIIPTVAKYLSMDLVAIGCADLAD